VDKTELTKSRTRVVAATAAMALALGGVAGCKPTSTGSSSAPPTASVSPSPTPTRTPSAATSPRATQSSSGAAAVTVSPATPQPTKLTAATFTTTVPALPSTVSVREMGAIKQNPRVADRDAGQSTLYGDKSVWFFADTTLQNPWGFLSNSAAATTNLNASNGLDLRSSNGFTVNNTATPPETIPRTAAELAFEKKHAAPSAGCKGSSDQYCGVQFSFWPAAVFSDPARHRVLFLYSKQCRAGQAGTPCAGGIGKGLGDGWGSLDMNTGRVSRLEPTDSKKVASVEGTDPTLFFGPGDKASVGGNAALVVDDTVYLYGQCTYFDCAVARVALTQFGDRSAWRYYNGKSFGADPTAAARVGVQSGGSGNTVFYDPALKAYVDVYMPWGYNTVYYRVGGSPYGPWSDGHKLITTAGDTAKPNYSTYAHPEFAEKNGLVQYISYYNAKTGTQSLLRWEMKK
jgi:hypothetical protein